jgi:hypothetical protein
MAFARWRLEYGQLAKCAEASKNFRTVSEIVNELPRCLFLHFGLQDYASCNINNFVHRFTDNQYDINMRRADSFLTELLLVREGKLQLSINDSYLLSHSELNDIIAHICTT